MEEMPCKDILHYMLLKSEQFFLSRHATNDQYYSMLCALKMNLQICLQTFWICNEEITNNSYKLYKQSFFFIK